MENSWLSNYLKNAIEETVHLNFVCCVQVQY